VAEAAGGSVHPKAGITWTSAPGGSTFAFPRLSQERLELLLPRFLEDAVDTREASCWSLLPTHPPELGEALLAAGFRDGWQAHWMAVDVGEPVESLRLEGVRVAVVDVPWAPTDLPWDGPGMSAARARLLDERPQRVWHVGAWRGSRPVGMPRSASRPTSSASPASTTWASQLMSAGAESARRSRRRPSSWDGPPAVELRR